MGTVMKSWQMHSFWQQNGPTVVGQPQTKPLLQRVSLGSLMLPVSPSEQSSSLEQEAVQKAPSWAEAALPRSAGRRQIRLGHSSAGEVTVAKAPPEVPASATGTPV